MSSRSPRSLSHARFASAVVVAMVAGLLGLLGPGPAGASPSERAGGAYTPRSCATPAKQAASREVAVRTAERNLRKDAATARKADRRLDRQRAALRRARAQGSGAEVRRARAGVARAVRADRRARAEVRDSRRARKQARARLGTAERALNACIQRYRGATRARLLSAELRRGGGVLLTFDRPMGARAADPGRYSAAPGVTITGAARLAGYDRVLLQTGTLFAVPYRFSVAADVLDATGKAVHPRLRTAAVVGRAAVSAARPRVTSAGSTGPTTVVVQFSKPMGDSALRAGSYDIVREDSGGVSGVPVTAARFTDGSRTSVQLTTGAQSEVTYRVQVSNVRDIKGLPLADRSGGLGGPVDPTSAVFGGTPPVGGPLTDTDCDGLSDSEELRGYEIQVVLMDGTEQTRHVTSDPGRPGESCDASTAGDTDGDGAPDAVERRMGTDPRDADTDDDTLTDPVERDEIYSSPTAQDSDEDGLNDGLEVGFFTTSSILADTDGDQISDNDELGLGNRNPRVADLPHPALEIGDVGMDLDVRFIDVTGTDRREVDSKEVSSTLEQSEGQEFSSTDSRTIEAGTKLSETVGFSVKAKASLFDFGGAKFDFSSTAEQSFNSSFLHESSESSSTETARAHEESLSSDVEVGQTSDRTREVDGASLRVAVTLKSASDVAFSIRNLQVTALMQNPTDPSRLTPVATLVPNEEPEEGFNLGPLEPERGPFDFENTQIFPSVVDELMRNPRGLVFKFSDYDLVDELGRNFAFTSQEVNDRTASLIVDYAGFDSDGDGTGAGDTERARVATGTGRLIDTNGDGVVGAGDRRVAFDPEGRTVGVTLRDSLAAMGLTEYDEQTHPTSSLTQAEIDSSYSFFTTESGAERIFRVRRVGLEVGVAKQWEIVTPTGIDQTITLDDHVVRSGESVTLAFIADVDEDQLPAPQERISGCSDDAVDTDGDGLDDRFEATVGWRVQLQEGAREVRSSCSTDDTDGDGRTDDDEAPGDLTLDEDGLIEFETSTQPRRDTSGPEDPDVGFALTDPITDPSRKDSDGDGLEDDFELTPYQVDLLSPPAPPGTKSPLQATSPEHRDSDGDTASDGVEARVGGDPREADLDNFGDEDQDGLVNALESIPYDITVEGVSDGETCVSECEPGEPTTRQGTSDPEVADSDGDGLTDGEERALGTDARETDTDGDGLQDGVEVEGFELRDQGQVTTDPLDVDSDDDKRADGAEAGVPPEPGAPPPPRLIVRVPGAAPYEVFTHPNEADADFDQLVDGDEAAVGTDPGKSNTDGDNRSDYSEVSMGGRRPLVPDLRVRVNIAGLEVIHDGETGGDAGDFEIGVGLRKPNGELTCEGQDGCGELWQYPLTSAEVGDFVIDLDDCPSTTHDGTCRQPGLDLIQIQSEYGLPRMNREVLVGSVGTGEAELESFSFAGAIQEFDSGGLDCFVEFPDPQAGKESSGTVLGTDLVAGTSVFDIERTVRCGRSRETLEIKLLATYTAD